MPCPKRLKVIFCALIASVVLLSSGAYVHASTVQSKDVTATAKVGKYSLSLQGIIAPFASVILIQDDLVLRSVVADANGVFTISQVAINSESHTICLEAIDVKRLGESYTCIDLGEITGDVVKNNIFLPPTLGLVASEINVGDTAVIWGYSMPGATVTVYISGTPFTTTADSTGFYRIDTKMSTAGSFQLFADATYSSQKSLKPTRTKTLDVLSLPQIALNAGRTWLENLINWLRQLPFGFLWIGLPLVILIFILLRKVKPEWFTWWDEIVGWLHRKWLYFFSRKLHHAWFVGY